MSTLSASERARGRRLMTIFQGLNTISFLLLNGNIITLYALRLGGTSLLVGIITSVQYLALVFMFVGRQLVDRFGIKPTMGWGWFVRYILMVPLFASPFVAAGGDTRTALLLIVIGTIGFHVARGVGVIGFNPMVGTISEGKDRGAFLARLQIVNQVASIGAGLLMASLLGAHAPLSRYTLFISLGIVTGLFAALLIFRMPDPEDQNQGFGAGIIEGSRVALRRPSFRRFIVLFFFIAVALGLAGPFAVVYAKRVYSQADNIILLYTVVGNIGAILMGLLSRLIIDRLGAKPLYVFFTAFIAMSVLPLAIAPNISGIGPVIFLSSVFFFFQLGSVGAQNAAQNYFFAIISPSEFLNLGILYNFFFGIGAAVGSLIGGAVLDLLRTFGATTVTADFRHFYQLIFLMAVVLLFFVARLKNVGSYSVRNALNVIFSPRDLHAVALLNRLDKSRSVDEEVEVIRALGSSHSEVPVEELLQKLRHPRFYVRQQALRALEDLPADQRLARALINEVKNHKFTTAYIAARIIGRRGIRQGIRELRASVESADYLLQANAMLALGRLGDVESIPLIEHAIQRTRNPLVLIHAATALDELRSEGSIPLLMEILKLKHSAPFLRDEIILSIAGILGFGDWFYPHYALFLERARSGGASLIDFLDEKFEAKSGVTKSEIKQAVLHMYRDTERFSRESARLMVQLSQNNRGPAKLVPFIEASADTELMRFERFGFLVAAILVWSAC
ncbi:MAG TPA: MFS transporter [Spirochaetia bacterium]|nr:MFS transporter [Spirochaetia bacterium]